MAGSGFNWATAGANVANNAVASPALALPGMAIAAAKPLASDFTRGLGMLAHLVAPAPSQTAPVSGAQVAAPIVAPAAVNPQADEAKLVSGAMRNPNITFPQIQALAGLVPLYNHPLDAKNMAGLQLYGLANANYQKDLAAANGDTAREQAATVAYQENLRQAMGANEFQDALSRLVSNGAGGGQ